MASGISRTILCIFLILSNTSQAKDLDQRAIDAADVFNNLCVQTFMRVEGEIDPNRFAIATLSAEEVTKWRPTLQVKTAAWIKGFGTDGEMILYYDPQGICAVEVKRADQASMEQSFESRLNDFANKKTYTVEKKKEEINNIKGNEVKSTSWNINTPDGAALIMLTTSALENVKVQHFITISLIR